MKIELRPVSSLKPYESNPRINDSAVDAVARSLKDLEALQQYLKRLPKNDIITRRVELLETYKKLD